MKKRIMIDLDDTITDYQAYLKPVNEFLNKDYKIEDVEGYYIQDIVPMDKREEFISFLITKNIYDYSVVYENCIEVIKKLDEKYDVYICSAYIFRDHLLYSSDLLKYKFEFLIKTFPFLDPNRFTFQTNKSIFDCHIKIDDKTDNLDNAELKLLYTAQHNKNISNDQLDQMGITRVNNWKDIADILL